MFPHPHAWKKPHLLASAALAAAVLLAPVPGAHAAVRPVPAAAAATVQGTPRPVYQARYVTVRPGDTLSSIAARTCGTAADWTGIYAANRPLISDPALIMPGWRLRIWCAARAVTAPGSRQGTSPAPQPPSGVEAFRLCVIQRESGGNPYAVNPYSGAGGLYQFLPSTWQALGFAGLPEDAPVPVQDQAFYTAYARWGTSPWEPYDHCTL